MGSDSQDIEKVRARFFRNFKSFSIGGCTNDICILTRAKAGGSESNPIPRYLPVPKAVARSYHTNTIWYLGKDYLRLSTRVEHFIKGCHQNCCVNVDRDGNVTELSFREKIEKNFANLIGIRELALQHQHPLMDEEIEDYTIQSYDQEQLNRFPLTVNREIRNIDNSVREGFVRINEVGRAVAFQDATDLVSRTRRETYGMPLASSTQSGEDHRRVADITSMTDDPTYVPETITIHDSDEEDQDYDINPREVSAIINESMNNMEQRLVQEAARNAETITNMEQRLMREAARNAEVMREQLTDIMRQALNTQAQPGSGGAHVPPGAQPQPQAQPTQIGNQTPGSQVGSGGHGPGPQTTGTGGQPQGPQVPQPAGPGGQPQGPQVPPGPGGQPPAPGTENGVQSSAASVNSHDQVVLDLTSSVSELASARNAARDATNGVDALGLRPPGTDQRPAAPLSTAAQGAIPKATGSTEGSETSASRPGSSLAGSETETASDIRSITSSIPSMAVPIGPGGEPDLRGFTLQNRPPTTTTAAVTTATVSGPRSSVTTLFSHSTPAPGRTVHWGDQIGMQVDGNGTLLETEEQTLGNVNGEQTGQGTNKSTVASVTNGSGRSIPVSNLGGRFALDSSSLSQGDDENQTRAEARDRAQRHNDLYLSTELNFFISGLSSSDVISHHWDDMSRYNIYVSPKKLVIAIKSVTVGDNNDALSSSERDIETMFELPGEEIPNDLMFDDILVKMLYLHQRQLDTSKFATNRPIYRVILNDVNFPDEGDSIELRYYKSYMLISTEWDNKALVKLLNLYNVQDPERLIVGLIPMPQARSMKRQLNNWEFTEVGEKVQLIYLMTMLSRIIELFHFDPQWKGRHRNMFNTGRMRRRVTTKINGQDYLTLERQIETTTNSDISDRESDDVSLQDSNFESEHLQELGRGNLLETRGAMNRMASILGLNDTPAPWSYLGSLGSLLQTPGGRADVTDTETPGQAPGSGTG